MKINYLLRSWLIAVVIALACFSGSHAQSDQKQPKNTFSSATAQQPIIDSGGTSQFCSGTAVILTSTNAVAYQWYKDGNPIKGATAQTFRAAQTGLYRVRTISVNGAVGISTGLRITQANSWTGAAGDDNWNTPANWSCGVVPLSSDEVDIPGTTASAPQILPNSNAVAHSISLAAYSELKVHRGGTLTVTDAIETDKLASLILLDGANLLQINNAANTGNIIAAKQNGPMTRFGYSCWSSPVAAQTLYELSADVPQSNAIMQTAKGYLIGAAKTSSEKMPTTGSDILFIGTPNNGHIEIPLAVSENLNLIGNPYASAIDLDAFLMQPDNLTRIGGTVYLWPQNSGLTDNPDAELIPYNLLGGVAAQIDGLRTQPTQILESGHGFFVEALALGNAVFENTMRVSSALTVIPSDRPIEKHRLWLNLSNDNGALSQTLIGFAAGATDDIDRQFDAAPRNTKSGICFYSLAGNRPLSIQGRALPFDENQVVPLGFNTVAAGIYRISLDAADGLLKDRTVYLVDLSNQSTHNLNNGAYEFDAAKGTFDNRFELRFTAESKNRLLKSNAGDVQLLSKNGVLRIQSSQLLSRVTLTDASGRCVFDDTNLQTTRYESKIPGFHGQLLIARLQMAGQPDFFSKIVID